MQKFSTNFLPISDPGFDILTYYISNNLVAENIPV